jgi:hypothetical protein
MVADIAVSYATNASGIIHPACAIGETSHRWCDGRNKNIEGAIRNGVDSRLGRAGRPSRLAGIYQRKRNRLSNDCALRQLLTLSRTTPAPFKTDGNLSSGTEPDCGLLGSLDSGSPPGSEVEVPEHLLRAASTLLGMNACV